MSDKHETSSAIIADTLISRNENHEESAITDDKSKVNVRKGEDEPNSAKTEDTSTTDADADTEIETSKKRGPVDDTEWTTEERLKARIGMRLSDGSVSSEREWDSTSSGQASPSDFVLFIENSPKTRKKGGSNQPSDQDATNISKEELTIYSPYVRKVFRAVIQYYPNIAYGASFIRLVEPYAPLFIYYSEMCDYASRDVPDASESPDDFKAFQDYYQRRLAPDYDKIRATLAQNRIQFDQLWALYRPGDLLFTMDDFGQTQLYSMISTNLKPPGRFHVLNETIEKPWRYGIDGWFVTWDNAAQKFTRSLRTHIVNSFEGTRNITSLACYPLKYHPDLCLCSKKDIYKLLEARGNAWKNLVTSPSCHRYNGFCRSYISDRDPEDKDKRLLHLNGRIIVDQEGPLPDRDRYRSSLRSEDETSPKPMKGTGYDDRYLELDGQSPHTSFTPIQAQLCPSTVCCFSMNDEKWYTVMVDKVASPEWAKLAFNSLVLDESLKTMLRGLVEQHKKNKGKVMSDIIEKKGKGLVVVLHGPPGVGKTLTAETVAELTEKPLYQINIGDVASEWNLHTRLQILFTQAAKWDAVLLLDEADVILEKRSYEDLRRNAVVSVFLRTLEYYDGILFMTTNRLRTMDPAFKSRIHIAIRYKELNSAQRGRIWENFIDRLDDSEARAKDEMRDHIEDLQEWELNGRQIRNVLMIAQSLALSKHRMRGALKFDHVEEVARRTLEFQRFF